MISSPINAIIRFMCWLSSAPDRIKTALRMRALYSTSSTAKKKYLRKRQKKGPPLKFFLAFLLSAAALIGRPAHLHTVMEKDEAQPIGGLQRQVPMTSSRGEGQGALM